MEGKVEVQNAAALYMSNQTKISWSLAARGASNIGQHLTIAKQCGSQYWHQAPSHSHHFWHRREDLSPSSTAHHQANR